MTSPPPLPLGLTGQLAPSVPGFNPTPVITAGDKQLADYLAMPTQQILDQLGLQRLPNAPHAAAPGPGAPANPGGQINPVDPAQLIGPVLNALSTLGTGQFSGMDPSSMLNGISNALESTAAPVQQALAAVQQGWQGASNARASVKTVATLANGVELATQATGLQNSLSAAVADVAKAQAQLIAIINEYLETLAALLPSLIFPWGWAALVAAAAKAVAETAQVMTETQSSLVAQASAVTAIGAPVAITAAPQLSAMMAGPLSSLLGATTSSMASPTSAMSALSMLSPLVSVASLGISPALSAVGMAASPAASAGAQSATLAADTDADPKSKPQGAVLAGKVGGPAGAVSPAAAGGSSGGAPPSRIGAPMPPAAPETTTTAIPSPTSRPAMAGIPMGGGGMMGAPLTGAGQPSGAHTAASFLHTSDQGGKVVSDRATVAPPVLGEADPNDIELRI